MVVTRMYASWWVLCDAQLVRGQGASSTGTPACCVHDTHLFGARQRTLCA